MKDHADGTSDTQAQADPAAGARSSAQARTPDALSRLAGGIGHEFRNLLMIIHNYADFIREGLPAESELHEDLAELVAAADRATRLTDDLVAFGRGGAAGTRPVDLAPVVAAAVPRLRELLADGVELQVEIAPGLAPVEADDERIRQILEKVVVTVGLGLTGGAVIRIEATELRIGGTSPGEWAAIEAARYVLLAVGDRDGDGEPPPELAEGTFGRGASANVGGHGGLGLAMVHGIVEAWGGVLEFRSGKATGTVVRLLLPCASPAACAQAATGTADAPHAKDVPDETDAKDATATTDAAVTAPAGEPGDRAPAGDAANRVLVCEDERAIRTMCARALRAAGFEVLLAEDGDAGIRRIGEERAAGRPLDLLVSDIVMPGSSGFDVAFAARERYPDVSIVLMTAFSEELARRAPPSGTLVLEKPFPAALLVERARALAGG